jgi:hypothetical protein
MSAEHPYPTDVTDAPWEFLQSILPERPWRPGGRGRPPSCDMRRMGQGFQHARRSCHAQSLCGLTTKLPPSTRYENGGHVSTFWQLVQQ